MAITVTDNVYQVWQRVMLYGPLNKAECTPAEWYQMLNLYYLNNGLYDAIQQAAYENAIWTPGMKGLRNPAHRAVEFYVAKLWPGALPEALPIVVKEGREKIIDPIRQIWKWSNFGATKQVSARWVSKDGDWFVKVASNTKTVNGNIAKATRVFHQNIKPEYVTEFDEDERGFLTYICVEIPKVKVVDRKRVAYLHVETWNKETQLYKRYELLPGQRLTEQTPVQTVEFSEFGIDFVPFVHAKFQDVGEKRGVGCFVHALDKIDEANRMATRLHHILFRFNKPTTAVSANAQDAQGRPLPPPTIAGSSSSGEVQAPDNDLWLLPGMAKLESIVPNLQYDAYLNAIKDQMDEIKQDLPEIKYFQLSDNGGTPSGKAVRLLLGDAVDKVIELRGNMETALARADAMALTIAQHAGLFKDLGSYDNGDFEHSFAEREVIASGPEEQREEDAEFWTTWSTLQDGPIPFQVYAKARGKSDEWISEALKLMDAKALEDKTSMKL